MGGVGLLYSGKILNQFGSRSARPGGASRRAGRSLAGGWGGAGGGGRGDTQRELGPFFLGWTTLLGFLGRVALLYSGKVLN